MVGVPTGARSSRACSLTYQISIRRTLCARRLGVSQTGFEQFSPECVPRLRGGAPGCVARSFGSARSRGQRAGHPVPGGPKPGSHGRPATPLDSSSARDLRERRSSARVGSGPQGLPRPPSGRLRRGSGAVLAPVWLRPQPPRMWGATSKGRARLRSGWRQGLSRTSPMGRLPGRQASEVRFEVHGNRITRHSTQPSSWH
jgi:hypothetical protein